MDVQVRNGSFHYPGGALVLRNVNFEFDGRGVFAVLGPNGAGKTTLLKCLLGLMPWSTGESLFNGKPLSDWHRTDFWQRAAYVPQAKLSNLASLSIAEYVVLGRSARIGLFSSPGKADWIHAQKALEEVGIPHLSRRLCSEVSGGQLQLAAIARALANDPELLILDEPESNLDFRNQALILEVIDRLTERGPGVILNTHFPAHALSRAKTGLLVPRGEPPVFAPASEIFTEAALSKLFGIDVKIRTLQFGSKTLPVVAALP